MGASALRQTSSSDQVELYSHNQNESIISFLDLPAELRNIIYKNSLIEGKPIVLRACEPSLLAANKQVRNEALAIYYGANIFQCRSEANNLNFFRQTDKTKLSLMHTLRAVSDADFYRIFDAVIMTNPKRGFDLVPLGQSFDEFFSKRLREHIHEFGERLVLQAEHHGVSKDAVFLPFILLSAGPEEKAVGWKTVEEYGQYDVKEKDGEIVFVRAAQDS